MEKFKEFQGKSLDEAISEACAYYNVSREKLEVEIVEDAKSGIFGLVGVRKAKVHARRAQLPEAMGDVLNATPQERKPKEAVPTAAKKKATPTKTQTPRIHTPAAPVAPVAPIAPVAPAIPVMSAVSVAQPAPVQNTEHVDDMHDDIGAEVPGYMPFEHVDTEKLVPVCEDVVMRLIEPIVGRVPIQVHCGTGRVHVSIDCGEDSGLLIGREGQTLASLQYLASRMLSRAMQAAVRVQLDAGDYRSRQDEKLRDMALHLAQRVCTTGRSYSTRPLSSYHRRIIHMTLQDMPDVQTRSSGEGPLKRVVLLKKKHVS